jgi:hypothetical protein
MSKVSTVAQFVEACRELDNEGIYILFEYKISQSLRNEIYDDFADPTSPEPVRSAMEVMGYMYGVKSLRVF